MRRKLLWIAPILLAFVFFTAFSYKIEEEETEKNKVVLQLLYSSLEQGHYSPIAIDDAYSAQIFKEYVERVDYGKRFFTENDLSKLKKFDNEIDDQFKRGSTEFFDATYELFKVRFAEAEKICLETLEKPFDFSKEEKYELDPDKVGYPKNTKELKQRWYDYLKYQTLARVVEAERIQKADTTLTPDKIKSLAVLEEENRGKVKESMTDYFKRMKELKESDWFSLYTNTLANKFDPHSGYFPPKDKEDFDISMSGQFEGIGATLQEKDGEIKVSQIIPGSASDRQGELVVEDVILKVAQGTEPPVDIVGMRLDDAVRLIRGKKGTEVRLTVKKIDGTITVIPITRDIVVLEETFARSSVIERDGSKVGYIRLPKFYADFENKYGRRCATDVLNELIKLKAENVEGIILDLRNNGGGSLQDVVEMSGLFIDKGPIVQVKYRDKKPYILEDKDPSVIYDGNMVVLVNEFSASASEILAAALQDYKRAIIVGTPTFGKGTVQRFFDMDELLAKNSYTDLRPFGALKLTIQKFYRIDGGSTQLKGVTPDIIIPDSYRYLNVGEREDKNAMIWDEINRANYKKWDKELPIEKLKSLSESRMASDSFFLAIEENALFLKSEREQTLTTLSYEGYKKEMEQDQAFRKKFSGLKSKNLDLKAAFTKTDLSSPSMQDENEKKNWEKWLVDVEKDAYVREAFQILKDIQNL